MIQKAGRFIAVMSQHAATPAVRRIPHAHGTTFRRTKTWKESTDPDRDAEPDRTGYVIADRTFTFDEFGPLAVRPHGGAGWEPRGRGERRHRRGRTAPHATPHAARPHPGERSRPGR